MILEVHDPGKKIRDVCKALGEKYSIRVIDLENVIYRNLGNGYDFEISNLDNRKKSFDATLYIWDTEKTQIVETISGIHSLEELKCVLDSSAEKYQSLAGN